ncbi:class I glutamine amidotransferase-like protein [Mycena sp. CBHHK59/15]|nr:class I glutamine amidotransferase-like protein [Mycena sp. CBHHK59/15]
MPENLSIAVCVSDDVTLSDFIPPIEIISGINDVDHPVFGAAMGEVLYQVSFEYLSPTLAPVVSTKGSCAPTFNPTMTYTDALASGKQFDILWVPAGPMPDHKMGKSHTAKDEIDFIAAQAPKAKYIMSVCGGSFHLAEASVLSGKWATMNKALNRRIVAATPKDIQWVPKARWVVDSNIWTSSGVTAGSDMALAFVEHLVGKKATTVIHGVIEIPEVKDQDDPFATFHGLV